MERIIEPAELKNSLNEVLILSTMTLATSGRDGEVHAADVYFACDEQLTLYFFSAAESQHSSDIQLNVRAAATIHADRKGWEQILGLQLRGNCKLIRTPPAWQKAWEIYLAKFPFVKDLEEVVKVNQLYGFKPDWIRLVDNRKGFGYKREWLAEKINTNDGQGYRWVRVADQVLARGQTDG